MICRNYLLRLVILLLFMCLCVETARFKLHAQYNNNKLFPIHVLCYASHGTIIKIGLYGMYLRRCMAIVEVL